MGITSRGAILLAAAALAFGFRGAGTSTYEVLHGFAAPPYFVLAALISDDGGILYGTSQHGGAYDAGTVFRIQSDGTGLKILHSFDVAGPGQVAALVLDASGNLFGTTFGGGSNGAGTIFRIRTDGSDYQVLHDFNFGPLDGAAPISGLAMDSAGNLYGTTYFGGAKNLGTVFSVKVDGSDFALLHSFAGGPGDGSNPSAGVVRDGSGNLYGATSTGGTRGMGALFAVAESGVAFRLLHSFTGGASDGRTPDYSSVVFDGSGKLYGTTTGGGNDDVGTVYRVQANGAGFTVLHAFRRIETSGSYPETGVTFDGSGTLYGTTSIGGPSNAGTIFKLRTDGTAFAALHSFSGGATDGAPFSPPLISGSGRLNGVSSVGLTEVVYSLDPNGANFTIAQAFLAAAGSYPLASLVGDAAGYEYGTTSLHGEFGSTGTIFRLKGDGTDFSVLHSFADGGQSGSNLILGNDGYLYGTTERTCYIYRLKTDGTKFSVLHHLPDCQSPSMPLVLDSTGALFGVVTPVGDESHSGAIFTLRSDGSGFKTLHSFKGGVGDGAAPNGPLLLDGGGSLFGTTYLGGAKNVGTVYRLGTDGSGFVLMHSFFGSYDGAQPVSGLTLGADGILYGTTQEGGNSAEGGVGEGTVFRIRKDGTGYSVLHAFTFSVDDGFLPSSPLELDGNDTLFGTTLRGGSSDNGTLFAIQTDGSRFSILHSFAGYSADGASPLGPLSKDASGNYYGTTQYGGLEGGGIVYRFAPSGSILPVVPPPVAPVSGRH
ncbi:MAG: choice-of-anchor tandem repeat GloVer-containing protein [Thermoanaerobaculia bacterium]